MRQVLVRFACEPDATVRRKVISVGRSMRIGRVKTFVLLGYLCRLKASAARTTGTVIDPPTDLLSRTGGVGRGGGLNAFGITTAGTRSNYRPVKTLPPEKKRDKNLAAGNRLTYAVLRSYPASNTDRAYNFAAMPVSNHGFGRAWTSTVLSGASGADQVLSGSSTDKFGVFAVWGSERLVVSIRDKHLQAVTNQPLASFATSYDSSDTPLPEVAPVTPTGSGQSPYLRRWNNLIPRQYSASAIAQWEAQATALTPAVVKTLLVAPFSVMPAHQFMLFENTIGDGNKWYRANVWTRRAAVPGLLIAGLITRAALKNEKLTDIGVTVSTIGAPPSWLTPKESSGTPLIIPEISETSVSWPSEWPAYFRPDSGPLTISRAIIDGDGLLSREDTVDESGIDSYEACTLGATATTVIDDEVELIVGVRCTARYDEPITAEHRVDVAGIAPRFAASVRVTKVGLMRVRIQNGISAATLLHHDLIGPATCPLFSSADMPAAVAFMPQVMWGGVINGERCYMVRAVRYARSAFLGGVLQDISTDIPKSPNYRGVVPVDAGSYRTPGYGTDLGFGAYADAVPEEVWWLRGNSRTVIPVPSTHSASHRAIEGASPDQSSNAWFSWYASAVFSHMAIDPNAPGWPAQYALEEYYAPGTSAELVAAISSVKVLLMLPPKDGGGRGATVELIAVVDGEATHYAAVATPWVIGEHYSADSQRFPIHSLTCYQQEVVVDGALVKPAGLLLTVASGLAGYALVSRDGGVTWEPLVYAKSSFAAGKNPGVSPMGYHFLGNAAWRPKQQHPFD
jgi:hypothetical protein